MSSSEKRIIAKITEIVAQSLPNPADLDPYLQVARMVNEEGNTGNFSSRKSEGVQYESGIEKKFIEVLDNWVEVIRIKPQSIPVEYSGTDDKPHLYYPDIACEFRSGQVALIEVKPAQTVCELYNYRKFSAAKKYCRERNWHFIVFSPREGAIRDMANEHVPPAVEKDFLSLVGPGGKTGSGVNMEKMKAFKEEYDLNERVLVAIGLRHNLAIRKKPFEWVRLQQGESWADFF
jgi:hypothetical protein